MSSKESGHLDQTLRISATKMLQLKKYTASLSWLLSLLVLCFVVFFLAPRRGADLFEDEGWFLVNAWSAAQGGNPDLLMPQAAHYLVNALLMKLGTTGILPLKQLFLLGIYVASCGLFLSLTPLRWQSPIVPMAI